MSEPKPNCEITDADALQAAIGKLPGPRDLKVIDFIDTTAQRWIDCSPFAFFAFGDARQLDLTAAGGETGFAKVPDSKRLLLPLAALDDATLPKAGQSFASLFLTPSLCETLRVNGRVAAVANGWAEIEVRECYLHCAKALLRSDFWKPAPQANAGRSAQDYVSASRFIALATIDAEGRADVSPKGDPSGAMIVLKDGNAWYADRPGNRRVDSFRNILTQPRLTAAALIPGSTRIVTLSGGARISTDESMRKHFIVAERVPKLVTCVEIPEFTERESAAIRNAQLWPAAPAPADIDPAAMFVAHVKHSKTGGLVAAISRAALNNIPGLMQKGLDNDYKKNMY